MEERWRDGELRTAAHVAVHESFASKNTCVTADIKQKIELRFMLNIADTDHLKIGPDTEALRSHQDIPKLSKSSRKGEMS